MTGTQSFPNAQSLKAALIAIALVIGTCAAGAQASGSTTWTTVASQRCLTTPVAPHANKAWEPQKWQLDQLLKSRDMVSCPEIREIIHRRLKTMFENPFDQTLRQMDELQLTRAQADSLAALNKYYSRARDELAQTVAVRFSFVAVSYDIEAVWKDALPLYEAFAAKWGGWGTAAKSILKPNQLAMLQPFLTAHLDSVCVRDRLLRTAAGQTEAEWADAISKRRSLTGCPW
jgi:hypothetical protein